MIKDIAAFINDDNATCDVVTKKGEEYFGCNVVEGGDDRVMAFEWKGRIRLIPLENIDYIDYYDAEEEIIE